MRSNPTSTNRPLLIGIIVDVSSSMRRNWKNREGKHLPQIEIIKEGLNRQIRKIKSVYSEKPETKDVELFCIGMGFKRPKQAMRFVDLSRNKEQPLNSTAETIIDATIVCDILALTEIIPTKADLEEIENVINAKWSNYSNQLLQKVDFRESLYDDLVTFIRDSLYQTALKRLTNGIRGRIFNFLRDRHFSLNSEWLNDQATNLNTFLIEREKEIRKTSFNESDFYLLKIRDTAKRIVESSINEYEQYIRSTLNEFVSEQSNLVLELLTLGHSAKKVFDTFDETRVFNLAKTIYDHLELDVRPKIQFTWLSNRARLNVITRLIGGKIDDERIKKMTEEVIQKIVWEKLRRFIRIVVDDLFKDAFRKSAKAKFFEWIDLASSREVTRSIKDIVNILPDALEQEIYSDQFMFGTTPIGNAIKKASLRLMDVKYSDYKKVLITISDGEFSDEFIPEATTLLKDTGVKIISLHISNKNVVSELVEKAEKKWSTGAKIMFEMSSISTEDDSVSQALEKLNYKMEYGKKLFVQVNHSQAIEDILDALLVN
jgi:von Willebrand factor type A domain